MFSSGFDLKNPYKGYGKEKLEIYVRKHMRLKSAPGQSYRYSNLGYGLLGYALSKISGTSYEALIQERIAEPYGMERTGTSLKRFREQAVQGLNKKGKPTPYWELRAMKGAGALFSTVEDLSSYVKANFDTGNAALRLQQRSFHTVNERMDMALGWHLLKQKEEGAWHWHNGGTGGFRSSFAMDLDQKEAAIVLSNIGAGHKRSGNIDRLSFLLLKTL
jgi:CubicO group peptidase (beta-lactamase class C family)